MNVYFNVSPGNMHGKIEKEVREGPLDGLNISITVDEARALWEAGKITDCNLSFRRLATEHDFDVRACLDWYKAEAKAERERQEDVRYDPQPGDDEPLNDDDVPHSVFRDLSAADVAGFESWADENYVPGSEVSDLWHPAVKARCAVINREAGK